MSGGIVQLTKNPVGRPRSGEYRECVDCGCRIYVRKRDILSKTAGKRCRACQRKHTPISIREAKERKRQTSPTMTQCNLPCGYYGNEMLIEGEKTQCPKCGMGLLKPFNVNGDRITEYEACSHSQAQDP